jgi:hypothetical protein
MSHLHIWNIIYLLHVWFVNILTHSGGFEESKCHIYSGHGGALTRGSEWAAIHSVNCQRFGKWHLMVAHCCNSLQLERASTCTACILPSSPFCINSRPFWRAIQLEPMHLAAAFSLSLDSVPWSTPQKPQFPSQKVFSQELDVWGY